MLVKLIQPAFKTDEEKSGGFPHNQVCQPQVVGEKRKVLQFHLKINQQQLKQNRLLV